VWLHQAPAGHPEYTILYGSSTDPQVSGIPDRKYRVPAGIDLRYPARLAVLQQVSPLDDLNISQEMKQMLCTGPMRRRIAYGDHTGFQTGAGGSDADSLNTPVRSDRSERIRSSSAALQRNRPFALPERPLRLRCIAFGFDIWITSDSHHYSTLVTARPHS
jgi:hypothetical protein